MQFDACSDYPQQCGIRRRNTPGRNGVSKVYRHALAEYLEKRGMNPLKPLDCEWANHRRPLDRQRFMVATQMTTSGQPHKINRPNHGSYALIKGQQ